MQFDPNLESPLLALLALVALGGWAVWSYARTRTPIGAGSRRLLLGLRLAASLLLSVMIGGFSLGLERVREKPPLLRVLVDASASMSRSAAGESGGVNRYDAARALLEAADRRWGERLRIEASAFGAGLMSGPLPETATGPLTDLGGALAALPPAEAGEALLILSDGCDTEGRLWSGRLDTGRRIHTLALGDSLSPPDLRIDRVDALPVLRKGRRLPLGVLIGAEGETPRSGHCVIRDDEKVLARQAWQMEPGESQARLSFGLDIEELGQHLLEIELKPDGQWDGDSSPENDRRLQSLRVVESRLKVLLLAGSPDWDLAALVQSLRGEETLALELITAGPDGVPRRTDTGEPWSPEEAPIHGLLLHSWHADWEPDLLDRLPLQGGVALLAGFLERPGRARLPTNWALDLAPAPPVGRELTAHWGEDAGRHPALAGALALGPLPREQAPLESVQRSPLAAGRVLLRAGGEPLLVTRELGGQRIALCGGRGFWRWSLRGEDGALLHAELFSGLLRWLARENPPERLAVSWEGEILASRPGLLHAEAFDEDFNPLRDAVLDWSIERVDTLVATGRFAPAGDEGFRAELPALPAGAYALSVGARLPSGERLERSLELPVLLPRGELMDLAARPETLRWLAARGGGAHLATGDLAELDAHLDFTPRAESSRRLMRLWQHPLAFLLLLGLLGLEWGLRKRFGMI